MLQRALTIQEHARAVAPRVTHSLQVSAGEGGVMAEAGATPMATGDGARRHSVSKSEKVSQLSCEIGIDC